MPDFLDSESIRWVIGTLITLGVGLAAIFVPFFLNRRHKKLWYGYSVFPLIREEVEETVEVLFEGNHVPNAYVSILDLHYRGTDPILEDDYRTPVTFDYGDAQVLSAEVIDTTPDGINSLVAVEGGSKVVFKPLALNDNNRIRARALTTNSNTPGVSGHIVGIKEIRDQRDQRDWGRTAQTALLISAMVGVALLFISDLVGAPVEKPLGAIGFTIALVASIIGFSSTSWRTGKALFQKYWKRQPE